uniref:F-box domain-containing protein n=1 Tax=Meloidogyne hapla TaxID=6305 RepID=A0A1I8BC32_MELHA
MNYLLPNETKIDIFKFLNYKQLFSIKQTNRYFNKLINSYEDILARKNSYSITIKDFNQLPLLNWKNKINNLEYGLYYCNYEDQGVLKYTFPYTAMDINFGYFDFPLNNQLLNKWQSALDRKIPVYLKIDGTKININKEIYSVFINIEKEQTNFNKFSNRLILRLPIFPKNIDEMKIIRCCLEGIFHSSYLVLSFIKYIFNPEIIKILFDDNEDAIPLRFV